MKKFLTVLLAMGLIGCSDDVIKLDDHKDDIDRNAAEIALLKVSDALQDLRLDSLEGSVSSLEDRMTLAEDAIDVNTSNIDLLFTQVSGLDQELSDLRSDFRRAVRELKRADRRTRRFLRRGLRSLRYRLNREIRQRRLADNDLQDQIDDLERSLRRHESRQSVINRFLTSGLFITNLRISQLQSRVLYYIRNLDSRLDTIESEIISINNEISSMNNQISSMQAQINDVESKLVSVVYPCGDNNGSEEVLLQTQDGLVAYFQSMRNKTISISDSITIEDQVMPGHYDRYCVDTNFFNGECNEYDTRYIPGYTVEGGTYNIGDSQTIRILKYAYLDVLSDGNYGTTDGFSCNFSISNGEVVND